MKAVILAGGFGTRLQSVVNDVPKPLAPIGDKPFLAWLIASLAAQGVSCVTLSLHHQWENVRDYFSAHPAPVKLDYVVESQPLGTGGAMRHVLREQKISEPVLVLNGDTYVQADLKAFAAAHATSGASLSMVLRPVADSGRYGTVEVKDNIITAFGEGNQGKSGLINAGVYILSPILFNEALPEAFSFERDFLPPRLATLRPRAFMAGEYFIDIGIPEDYARAQRELPQKIMMDIQTHA